MEKHPSKVAYGVWLFLAILTGMYAAWGVGVGIALGWHAWAIAVLGVITALMVAVAIDAALELMQWDNPK